MLNKLNEKVHYQYHSLIYTVEYAQAECVGDYFVCVCACAICFLTSNNDGNVEPCRMYFKRFCFLFVSNFVLETDGSSL